MFLTVTGIRILNQSERFTDWWCGCKKAAVDLQIVMSWCPPRHCPPCSSLLIMLDGASFAFVPHPAITPVFFLVIFFFSLSPLVLSCGLVLSPFLAPSQPGCVSELTSQRSASENQSLAWHDMQETVVRSGRDTHFWQQKARLLRCH